MKPTIVDLFLTIVAVTCLYPASVTSVERTAKRNKKVGGKANSRHRMWMAWDLGPDDPKHRAPMIAEFKRQGYKAMASNNGAVHVQTP